MDWEFDTVLGWIGSVGAGELANLATLARGARIFRVHDVAEHRAAFAVWDAIEHG